MFNYEQNLIFWQLLLYGCHIGHRFRNSSLYAGWLIFTYSYETLIINLYKTILGFKNGRLGFDYCVRVGSPIWFLNLNKAFEIYICESALKCGEFAYTTYWIHGMISNWICLADQLDQLCHYTEDAHKGQFSKLDMNYSPWFMSRWSWPRALLISSVNTSEWPSHECLISKIPSLGIVDTNISGHISNIATPGNDDSLESMVYYNTSTSLYILEKKYMHVTGWLHHIRESKRNITFSEWILRHFIKNNGLLNKKKIYKIINDREKKEKIRDYMQYFITYKINIIKFWGLGVKFFFGVGSGEGEFQGGLDLYSQNNEKIKDKFDIYSLMEKFKLRGFFICKILNLYLLKGLWHNSSSAMIKKKFLSKKWFKFRFLTTSYYEKVWMDDYYKTNFLVNRFWRNRIYKTYLRRSKYRNNIFLLKFFKFYNIYNFNIKRGFLDTFSSSYMKVSSFANIVFSYGFNYFKKHFYKSLIGGNFLNAFFSKKFSFLSKWLFFKKQILSYVNKMVFKKKYSLNIKFSNIYKVYSFLKKNLKNYIYIIYSYLNFYYSFWYWNKSEYKFIKITRKWNLIKKFRALKNLNKLLFYLEISQKTIYPFIRFQKYFLKKNVNIKSFSILNTFFSKIFSLLSINCRKNYFSNFLNFKNVKVRKIKRYFKKLIKKNKYKRRTNLVISTLDRKFHKFKKTKEVKKEVNKLYKIINKNYFIQFFNKIYKSNFKNKYNFTQFLNLFKKNKKLKRLYKYNEIQYNIPGFDFYQIKNNNYSKKYLFESSFIKQYKNQEQWFIEDNLNFKLHSIFFKIYAKTKQPIHCSLLKNNLNYFNKTIINLTFNNLNLELIKLKKIIKFFKKKNYTFLKIKKYLRKIKMLKYKYKRHTTRSGLLYNRYITGYKFFYVLNNIKLWSLIKKNYFVDNGFNFKNWQINFNKTYPKKENDLVKPIYYLKNIRNYNISNYTYLFYIRFYSLFFKYLCFFKKNTMNNLNTIFLKKYRTCLYYKETKKTYWS